MDERGITPGNWWKDKEKTVRVMEKIKR